MTAHLASIGPVGWAAIALGSWLILTVGLGRGIGKGIRYADEAMDENPPLPRPLDDAGWDEWVNVWPADTPLEVMEQAIFDRRFEQMPLVADDLRRSA